MPKHEAKHRNNVAAGTSTDTLLETWFENNHRHSSEERRETKLVRTGSIYDFLDYVRDNEDEYIGDITKLQITPLPNEDTDVNKPTEPKIEEVDCGEPFKEQHFYIDFTPIPGIDDDEELFQKNEDFWNFASSNKEMQKIMNTELQRVPPRLDLPSVSSTRSSTILSSKDILAGVNWLDKDEIDFTATTKPQPKYCDDEDDVYFSEDDIVKKRQVKHDKIKNTLRIRKLPQRSSYQLECAGSSKLDKVKLNQLRNDMDVFDSKNPKSFEPPGKSPELITATLQRHPFRGVIPNSENDLFKHYNSPTTI